MGGILENLFDLDIFLVICLRKSVDFEKIKYNLIECMNKKLMYFEWKYLYFFKY